jgi:hypothetical protein
MEKVLLATVLVLAIIFIVPIMVYGATSAVTGLKTPEGASPARFLTSVLVSKVGTAIAFVLIFYYCDKCIERAMDAVRWSLVVDVCCRRDRPSHWPKVFMDRSHCGHHF